MSDCLLCGGDGRKLVPIRNIVGDALVVHDSKTGEPYWVVPSHFARVESCDCQILAPAEKQPNA